MLGYFAAVAIAAGALLGWASAQPHAQAPSSEGEGPASTTELTPQQATAHFSATDIAALRTIAQDTLTKVRNGDQAGAVTRVKDLETTWDEDQPRLEPQDGTAWTFLDGRIDTVLTSVRASSPTTATEQAALTDLITSLG